MMRTTLSRSSRMMLAGLTVVTLIGSMGVTHSRAQGTNVTERDIEEFVSAQGTLDIGFLFVPPVENFLGWSDPGSQLGMSVDYAGLADAACNGIAGTSFAGIVKEKTLSDGRAEVSVELLTVDAIAWVVDLSVPSENPFGENAVVLGVRWEEDIDGNCVFSGEPALGSSKLKVKFINPEPGHPMPDLIQLLFFPEEGQEMVSLDFHAEAEGELKDGTQAHAETHQVLRIKDGELVFPTENVFIEVIEP